MERSARYPSSQHPQERVGGQLERASRGAQAHAVQAMLDGAFQYRGAQLVLREIGVEEQAVVADLVPLSLLPSLADALVETCPRQRIRDGVAHIVEGQTAR